MKCVYSRKCEANKNTMKETKCSENHAPQLTSQYFDVLFSVFQVVLIVNSFLNINSRKEIEPFLPPLKPDYCVKQAMRAILTDQPMICTPRLMYIVTFMKR